VSPTAVTATVTARKRKFSLFRTLSTLEFAFFLVLLKLTENARWKAQCGKFQVKWIKFME
jgi:hypothetical protein